MRIPFLSDAEVERALPLVTAHLQSEGLFVYPTETVYGLGGAATVVAVEALRNMKSRGRAGDKNFLLLVAGQRMLDELQLSWNAAAHALAGKFWPGPLTLVLGAAHSPLPASLRGSGGGVAVRWTSHPAISRLVAHAGFPVSSTSANPPGAAPAANADAVERYYSEAIARGGLLLLDGGPLPPSPPSTVVDCTGMPPRVIRAGAIASAELRGTVPGLIGND